MILTVDPRGRRTPQAPRPRLVRVLTTLDSARTEYRPTFRRPVGEPGGETRPEAWAAYSADGFWTYHRVDDGASSPWRVTYAPTGQALEVAANLTDARERTASGDLLRQVRAAAFADAYRGQAAEVRAAGHRALAVHMRIEGLTTGRDADARCECGGLLVQSTSGGRMAHVDACAECYAYGRGLAGGRCDHADGHRFCGDPLPVDCGHQVDNGCGSPAVPNRGAGCGRAGDVDCCGACCWGE